MKDLPPTLCDLPPTLPLWPDVAGILGMGRSKSYDLAKRGEFPVRLLKIGQNYRVSRADLLRYLGETAPVSLGGDAA